MNEADYPVEGLPTPDPAYDPDEVIAQQLDALADNDHPVENAGVKTAYNFASPGNRRATGPLDRFVRMVHGPTYRPMIDHVEAVTGPVERQGDRAVMRVTLTGLGGRTVTYRFELSKRPTGDGPLAGCWLTDSVLVE